MSGKNAQGLTEQEFLNSYNPEKYEHPSVTVDTLIFTVDKSGEDYHLQILLVRREDHPFLHKWAVPGGFVGMKESVEQAAVRKLEEETGLRDTYLEQLYTWGDVERDPRTRIISVSYIALIPREALKSDVFRMIVNTRRHTIPPTNKHQDETYLSNHHKMRNNYQGDEQYLYDYCIGGKTGYTSVAGSTLATFAEKDGMTLICVVMRETAPNHYIDTRTLFDYCFENFQVWNVAEHEKSFEKSLSESKIFENSSSFAELNGDGFVVLPKAVDFEDAEPKIKKSKKKSNKLGKIQYTYAGRKVGGTDIEITNVKVPEFKFQKEKEEVEVLPEENVVRIDLKYILLGIGAVILLIVIGFGIYCLADNFYLIRYKIESRRMMKNSFKEIKTKRRWRRK